MKDDILSILEYKMPVLSKGQKRIAALICEACDKTAFMTASALGKQAGVSESTVVRFAMELGYEGYPQMQKAMQERVMSRLSSPACIEIPADGDLIYSVFQADMEKMRKTAGSLDREVFQSAVQDISKAKSIYILGAHRFSMLANLLGDYLGYLFDKVHIITSSTAGEVMEGLLHLTKEDAVIAFSFPRYCSATVQGADYCHKTGAVVVGITNSSLSPLAEHCDHVLTAQSDKISLVDSMTAPLSLVNALVLALSAGREERLSAALDKLETVRQIYQIYEEKDDTL